jgi:hypothetical protein
MLGDFVVDSVAAVVVIAAWYLWFRRVNRRRSAQVVRWIEDAFAGRDACIRSLQWRGASHFRIELGLNRQIFRQASLVVRLEPRELPLQWLLSRFLAHKETVTFEAELDHRPSFNLYVQNYHWRRHSRRFRTTSSSRWKIQNSGPMVITTETDSQQNFASVIDVLLAARTSNFLHVALRRKAPQLVACAPLRSLSPGTADSGMFSVLQELAHSASTSMH